MAEEELFVGLYLEALRQTIAILDFARRATERVVTPIQAHFSLLPETVEAIA